MAGIRCCPAVIGPPLGEFSVPAGTLSLSTVGRELSVCLLAFVLIAVSGVLLPAMVMSRCLDGARVSLMNRHREEGVANTVSPLLARRADS